MLCKTVRTIGGCSFSPGTEALRHPLVLPVRAPCSRLAFLWEMTRDLMFCGGHGEGIVLLLASGTGPWSRNCFHWGWGGATYFLQLQLLHAEGRPWPCPQRGRSFRAVHFLQAVQSWRLAESGRSTTGQKIRSVLCVLHMYFFPLLFYGSILKVIFISE